MTNLVIENLIAYADINQKLPLQTLAISIPNTTYDEEEQPVLVFRYENPKRAVLITKKGQILCTGTNTTQDAEQTISMSLNKLKEHGIKIETKPEISIKALTASSQISQSLSLETIAEKLSTESLIHSTEEKPWLQYNIEPNISILIHSSGKIICTGDTNIEEAENAFENFKDKLISIGVLE